MFLTTRIGLRWEILTYFDNPQEWLHKHFSHPDRILPDNYYLEPRYIVIDDDCDLQISFHVVDITPSGQDQPLEAIAIQATIEVANLSDANRLIRLTNQWRRFSGLDSRVSNNSSRERMMGASESKVLFNSNIE